MTTRLKRAANGYGYTTPDGRVTVTPAYSGAYSRPSYWVVSVDGKTYTRRTLRQARDFIASLQVGGH